MSKTLTHHPECNDVTRWQPDCSWAGERRLPKPDPPETDPGFEVRESKVHGQGVFATRWWKPGDLVGLYEGYIVVDSEHPHVVWLQDEEERYFGIMGTGPLSYLNHADDGDHNAILASNSPFIYARKNILPGEEMFIDYGENPAEEEDG